MSQSKLVKEIRKQKSKPMSRFQPVQDSLNLIIISIVIYCSTGCIAYQPNSLNNQSGSTSASPHRNGQRPLDRPKLTSGNSMDWQNLTPPAEAADSAANWFMMGGGDLAPSEGRDFVSFSGSNRSNHTQKSTRRMAEMKSRKHAKHSNRTMFDDDQADSSAEANEIYDDIEGGDSTTSGVTKDPECASQGRYYCLFKEEYPLKLVTEVTKYYKWPLEKLFRDLHAQIMPKLASDSTGNLVCDSVTRVVRPGWARNTNDRWLVVINTENYHQYVTEVVCQYGSNSRCNFIPPCYYSSCQQRYNTQKLLVIDPSNPYRGPFLSEFLFPSCCVCYVPASSDALQDKYRPSPATIYQRTMQQEATSNLNPPQFRSPQINMLDEAFSSVSGSPGGNPLDSGSSRAPASEAQPSNVAAGGKQVPLQAPNPGEIRRGGEQYRREGAQDQIGRQGRRLDALGSEMSIGSFPRLGLADSLLPHKEPSRD